MFWKKTIQSEYRDIDFRDIEDRDSSRVIEGVTITDCTFKRCSLHCSRHPKDRQTVRHVRLINCRCDDKCDITAPILDDIEIENLAVDDVLLIWAPALRHVVVRGEIGAVNINEPIGIPLFDTRRSRSWLAVYAEANREFYRNVDWALDITEAKFVGVNLRGVPGELIRRDHETQFLVKRDWLLSGQWRSVDFGPPDGMGIVISDDLECLVKSNRTSEVLVASMLDPKHGEESLRILNRLRDAGFAE